MLEKVIKDVLSKEKLFSAMKISKLCAMDYNDVLKILDNHQDFKKSFLKSNGGYNVYYKKTFMNIFYDLVTSFRFFCYLRD